MSKKANMHVSGDNLPRELLDICLNCKKPKCISKCADYAEAVRKYNASNGKSTMSRNVRGVRTGYEPKRYPVYSQMLSAREAGEMFHIHPSTIRRHMKNGMTMQEVIENGGKKRRGM